MSPSRVERIGELTCRILTPDSPELIVLLCHGYGASGDDLVGLADAMVRLDPELENRVGFVFPEAPLELPGFPGFESRAWWHLDVAAVEAAIASGRPKVYFDEEPEGLSSVRETLGTTFASLVSQIGLPGGRFVLGGFSQGAMLTTELTFHLDETPAGLCILSGAPLRATEWKAAAASRTDLPVFQSHGRQDPLLAFEGAETLRSVLEEAGLSVDFVPFDGVHEIPLDVLVALTRFVRSLL